MKSIDQSPLFDHPLDEPTQFRPEELLDAVRSLNSSIPATIPSICVLDFDGDLVDALEAAKLTTKSKSWACFHTAMQLLDVAGIEVGIVGRTIGGPYSVLVAEQMAVSGAEVIVGLSSAGRVSSELALPSLVVPTKALRDEGTSTHYIEPGRYVNAPEPLAGVLAEELIGAGLPVARGAVWTTDAPYRETASQILNHANEGILAVEMQAASLFAFAQARQLHVGEVVHVTNATDNDGENFDKGADDEGLEILKRIARAGVRVIHSGKNGTSSRIRSSLG